MVPTGGTTSLRWTRQPRRRDGPRRRHSVCRSRCMPKTRRRLTRGLAWSLHTSAPGVGGERRPPSLYSRQPSRRAGPHRPCLGGRGRHRGARYRRAHGRDVSALPRARGGRHPCARSLVLPTYPRWRQPRCSGPWSRPADRLAGVRPLAVHARAEDRYRHRFPASPDYRSPFRSSWPGPSRPARAGPAADRRRVPLGLLRKGPSPSGWMPISCSSIPSRAAAWPPASSGSATPGCRPTSASRSRARPADARARPVAFATDETPRRPPGAPPQPGWHGPLPRRAPSSNGATCGRRTRGSPRRRRPGRTRRSHSRDGPAHADQRRHQAGAELADRRRAHGQTQMPAAAPRWAAGTLRCSSSLRQRVDPGQGGPDQEHRDAATAARRHAQPRRAAAPRSTLTTAARAKRARRPISQSRPTTAPADQQPIGARGWKRRRRERRRRRSAGGRRRRTGRPRPPTTTATFAHRPLVAHELTAPDGAGSTTWPSDRRLGQPVHGAAAQRWAAAATANVHVAPVWV